MPGQSLRFACSVATDSPEPITANAFRVLDQPGDAECFLDFLAYDDARHEARVVSRLRVRREFLPAMRDRLSETLGEVTGSLRLCASAAS